MKVDYISNSGKPKESDLFRIGRNLGIQLPGRAIIRLALSDSQWKALRDSCDNYLKHEVTIDG